MQRKLVRSQTDSMLGGVCGGLGEYLGVDSTLIRLAFVLLTVDRRAACQQRQRDCHQPEHGMILF